MSDLSTNANLIRQQRQTLGLTQRELANRVGTSQQQIQRVEAGIQTVRLELAVLIAKALEAPLTDIFPKLPSSPLRKSTKPTKSKRQPLWGTKELLDAGIDPDPRHWTLKFGLTDGAVLLCRVSSAEKDRVSKIIWGSLFDFVVFDSDTKRIAIRRSAINYCHFLFDVGVVSDGEEVEEEYGLDAFFLSGETIRFGVEPDSRDIAKDDEGFGSQLQRLFVMLEGDIDSDDIVWFDDEDNERVYIRSSQVTRLELPLVCCEPSLWGNLIDHLSEEGAIEGAETKPSEGKGTK